jgi:septum formation protein
MVPAAVDETPAPGERPAAVAQRLAIAKAVSVAAEVGPAFILGADTVVACGRRILGKARDEGEACRFLALLSGRRHRVFGGIAVVAPNGRQASRVVETTVRFKRLCDAEVDAYLASGEWRDKAGAYAIQGLAGAFVAALNGSYSNVVGLPLYETAALLAGLGYPWPQR